MVYTKENYNINTLKWTKDEKPCVVCGKNTHALDYCFESHICSTECMKKYTDEINKTCNKSESPEVIDVDMKWYIFNKDDEPLTWDDKVIYFPSLLSANAFIEAYEKIYIPEPEEDYYTNAVARKQILFYDGGYISVDDITSAQFDEKSPGFYDEYLRILKNYENG